MPRAAPLGVISPQSRNWHEAVLCCSDHQEVGPQSSVKVALEPKYNYAGQIEFEDGRRKYFKGTCFDLNPLGAAKIAKDKAYATFFMRRLGYKTVEGGIVFHTTMV